jgi:hypothetical protein
LSGRQVKRTLPQPDNAHSSCDRTAGDYDAFASITNELRHIGGETAKLSFIEGVGARPRENAGAELEENTLGLPVHAKLLHKPEKRKCAKAISLILSDCNYNCDRNIREPSSVTDSDEVERE